MEIMARAQSNPRIMAALQECMANPAAVAKYQNEPEIRELVNELQKYM
jgi:suppressor of tumorigenicity protein 13